MNPIFTTLRLALASSALIFSVAAPVQAQKPNHPENLTGNGVNTVGGTFKVHVVENPTGTKGSFRYTRANGFAYGGTLNCIHVDGNSAYVTGTITFSDDPGVQTPPLGFGIAFKVTDNGRGLLDTQSVFGFSANAFPPGLCDNPGFRAAIDGLDTLGFTKGNMVVRG